jgi:membrane protease YdiL (CAAX protease family)
MALVFGVGPWLLSLAPRWVVLPAMTVSGLACLVFLLLDPTFPRARLLDAAAARRGLRQVLLRTAAVWAAVLVVALVTLPRAGLFVLPRARPGLWLIVVLAYPVVSAYPQEVMYRAFFFHRYGPLFRRPAALIAANAALFGWAHLLVHNAVAVLLAAVGGVLLATTYARSRSTLLVAAEHALYGGFVFSAGVGGMFVNSVRVVSRVLR